jgi:dephospho-CoA kinase
MIIVGLTGSVAMGKTAAARAFRRLKVPVHDADAVVRRLLATDKSVRGRIGGMFPGTVRNGAVDRAALAARVFSDPEALRALEALLHPLVRRETRVFLARAARRRERLVVLDIPLLFETGGERGCDSAVVVHAPDFIQAKRFLSRPGMDRVRLAATRARQMPAREKLRRADVAIPTGLSRGFSFRRIAAMVAELRNARGGRAWNPGWPRAARRTKASHA